MNCQKCKIEIDERNLRREWLSDAATAHMAACASCRLFGEERLALSRLVGGLEKVSAPADFDFRMRARMAAEASARAPRSGWFNFSPAALSWPLAACFALVVSASFYFQQQPEPAATNTPAAPSRIAVLETPTAQTSNRETISQSVPAVDDETRQGMDATASKNTLAARRRVSAAGRVAMNTTVDATRIRERSEDSNSASLLPGAPVRFAANGATQGERALIPVQVSAEERPLKVLLRDTGGGARTISVESVSFGSRDVIGRPATISKASLSTNQGVW